MKGVRRVLAVALLAPATAASQVEGAWSVGASVSATLFVGGSSEFLNGGFGFDATVWRRLTSVVRLRADGMLMPLDAQEGPFERADNRVVLAGVGPEVGARVGSLSLYARGLVGIASNAQMRKGSGQPERTTSAAAYGMGAGLRLAFGGGLSLDLGGDVVKVGELAFARTAESGGDLIETPGLLRLRAGLRWSSRAR